MKIGKNRWRCRVEAHPTYGAVTNYQWFDESLGFWRDSTHWPTYDDNDSYDGLPKSLENLYRRHEPAILEAMTDGQEQWLADHPDAPDHARCHVQTSLQQNQNRLRRIPLSEQPEANEIRVRLWNGLIDDVMRGSGVPETIKVRVVEYDKHGFDEETELSTDHVGQECLVREW